AGGQREVEVGVGARAAGDRREVREARAAIDGQQGVVLRELELEVGRAAKRRGGFVPEAGAAGVAGVGGVARFLCGGVGGGVGGVGVKRREKARWGLNGVAGGKLWLPAVFEMTARVFTDCVWRAARKFPPPMLPLSGIGVTVRY